MKLGFVGVGNMGALMLPHLLEAGHNLVVHDVSKAALERAAQMGAAVVGSARGVAEAGEMVLTSLPTPQVVESVYLGERGLIERARPGQIFVDLSSISPSLARAVASRFGDKRAEFLDAPVSGGTTGAKAGTLAIMVGGDAEALRQVEPVLKCLGSRIFHAGPVGAGSTLKLLNQILLGINNVAVLEMMSVALRSGLDLGLVKEVISASTGFSRSFESRFQKIVDREYSRGFAVDLMAKDLRLSREMARDLGLDLPMASLAQTVFERAGRLGLGQEDVSAAIALYEGKDG